MSVHYKTLPVDVDVVIDKMQRHFSAALSGLTQNSEWYPRIYPVPVDGKSNQKLPAYFEQNKDYLDVFYNDRIDLMVFFVVGERADFDGTQYTRDVSMVVQANLKALYPGTAHLADEELHNAIHFAWSQYPIKKNWALSGFETGIENVFREFDTTKITLTDMQLRHVVRFNFTVQYTPKCCTNC